MAYWIIKSDPESYSWDQMKKDKTTDWDGVRNYQARNNLLAMKKNDTLLFYDSNTGKHILGEVTLAKEAFPDTTADDERWVAVKVKYSKSYKKPITLAEIKAHPKLKEIQLAKQSRLSVSPLTEEEYKEIYKLSN